MQLTITDTDRSLAAELGLFLVHQAETARDREEATDPRATRRPETWLVRSVLTKRPVGRLRFTPANCLYATKLASGESVIEETIADAIRWVAPVVRHVRTGAYDGTETIVRRFGSMIERPRAITACGARATGADYAPIAAKSELVNGRAHEMCPACRARLEGDGARDLSHLPEKHGSATPRQRDYIRRLLDEGAQNARPHLRDARDVDRLSSRDASATIDALKALKERDWKGAL